jgi:hypothetical protein
VQNAKQFDFWFEPNRDSHTNVEPVTADDGETMLDLLEPDIIDAHGVERSNDVKTFPVYLVDFSAVPKATVKHACLPRFDDYKNGTRQINQEK